MLAMVQAVILAVVLATATPTATPAFRIYLPVILKPQPPPPTPTPTVTMTPTRTPTATATTVPPPSGVNVVCNWFGEAQICAWVSNGTPAQNSTVTVYGRLLINNVPQVNRSLTATWRYKTTSPTCQGMTNSAGVASCSRSIGGATVGYQVNVDVVIDGYQATTWFVPR